MEGAPYLSETLCESSSVVFSPSEAPRNSFAELHRHARDILVGTVADIDQGFVNGRPSSLLAVDVETTLRRSGEVAASDRLYVVSPYAVFRIGSTTFCRTEPSSPYRPQRGDRLLLLPVSGPIDEHSLLLWPEPEEIIAEKASGELVVAKTLRDQAPFVALGNLDQLVERFREVLAEGGEEK